MKFILRCSCVNSELPGMDYAYLDLSPEAASEILRRMASLSALWESDSSLVLLEYLHEGLLYFAADKCPPEREDWLEQLTSGVDDYRILPDDFEKLDLVDLSSTHQDVDRMVVTSDSAWFSCTAGDWLVETSPLIIDDILLAAMNTVVTRGQIISVLQDTVGLTECNCDASGCDGLCTHAMAERLEKDYFPQGLISMPKPALQFGLTTALPDGITTAWGARLIFPDDLLHDRQSFPGMETEAGGRLKDWLNKGGALREALAAARKMSKNFKLSPESRDIVTLFEDIVGRIDANPESSYGYLYVAAWLKHEGPCVNAGDACSWLCAQCEPVRK